MAEDSNVAMSLHMLPTELLEQVVHLITSKDAKAFRLTSRRFQDIATKELFLSFTLYPHNISLERLANIAQTPYLQQCVQGLFYDASHVAVTDRIVAHLLDHKDDSDQWASRYNLASHYHKQKVQIESEKDATKHADILAPTIIRLANLKHLYIQDLTAFPISGRDGLPREEFPHFYDDLIEATCGSLPHLPPSTASEGVEMPISYATAVLSTARKLTQPLETLKLCNIAWDCPSLRLLQSHMHSLQISFSQLRALEITCDFLRPPYGNMATSILQILSAGLWNLDTIKLQFRNNYYVLPSIIQSATANYDDLPTDLASDLPLQLVSGAKPRRLCLEGLICTSSEFKQILGQCTQSLDYLEIGNLWLSKTQFEASNPCLVDAFRWMQQNLALKHLILTGMLTNGGMQDWKIDREARKTIELEFGAEQETLLARVEEWVLNGGICPLGCLAIKPGEFDLGKKEDGQYSVPRELRDEQYAGDETFFAYYPPDRGTEDEHFDNLANLDVLSMHDNDVDDTGYVDDSETDEDPY